MASTRAARPTAWSIEQLAPSESSLVWRLLVHETGAITAIRNELTHGAQKIRHQGRETDHPVIHFPSIRAVVDDVMVLAGSLVTGPLAHRAVWDVAVAVHGIQGAVDATAAEQYERNRLHAAVPPTAYSGNQYEEIHQFPAAELVNSPLAATDRLLARLARGWRLAALHDRTTTPES